MGTLEPIQSHADRLTDLGVELTNYMNGDAWRDWLTTAARFPKYSAANTLLIHAQRPNATLVQGYRAWQKMGRQVQKGQKALTVIAPMTRRDPDDPEAYFIVGFRGVKVFDIAQTEGDPVEPPWPFLDHPFDEDDLKGIAARAEARGFQVLTEEGSGDERGSYHKPSGVIRITPGVSLADQAHTLLHELAHAYDTDPEPDPTREAREIVAESVAWLLGERFGLQPRDTSVAYLATWVRTPDDVIRLADRVINVARKVEHLLTTPVGELAAVYAA